MTQRCRKVGLISDTHGLLRPEALVFLRGVDRIVHGGDIGHAGVLEALASIAPLTVVRGNNDGEAWADHLHDSESFTVGGVRMLAIHDLSRLDLDLAAKRIAVVVCGHSHRPGIDRRDGIMFVNPGSAGPRRFKLPIAVGELVVNAGVAHARIVELPGGQVLASSD